MIDPLLDESEYQETMFTGIVQERGEILSKTQTGSGADLQIKCEQLLPDLRSGDSVSIDGVCLTVTEKDEQSFTVTVSPETLRLTNIGDRRSGDPVNLEPAATIAGVLGGHLVQGHVDQTGEVLSFTSEGNSRIFRFTAPPDILHHCVLKGSITVNGVSLTISGLDSEGFEVAIIPHTHEVTNFKELQKGDRVNLEADVLSKYVESHVKRILGMWAIVAFLSSTLLLGDPLVLGPNSVLVYSNLTRKAESQFVLRLARFRPDIVLEWESESEQGTLHLYQQAIQDGQQFSLTGLFKFGVDVESEDELAMWLSEQLYRRLIEEGETRMRASSSSLDLRLEGEGDYPITLNRKAVQIPVIYAKDSRRGSWVFHRDPNNPLLVEYVSAHFRQSLRAVSTGATNKLRWIKKLPPVR